MEDVGSVKALNCVVVLNFDPLYLIGLLFDCCLIPVQSRLRVPLSMCAHYSLTAAVPFDSIDSTSMAVVASVNLVNWLATMDFEHLTFDLVAAKMDKAFEMICHGWYLLWHCCCLHSLGSCLPFDFWPHCRLYCCCS